MDSQQELYDQLSYYTLSLRDPEFIHQYAVDAYAAQHADESTKPITIAFALMGLYLHNERNFSGRMVQLAHIELAKKKRPLPTFLLPKHRGNITVADVLQAHPGEARNALVSQWSVSVWDAYADSHAQVKEWLAREMG